MSEYTLANRKLRYKCHHDSDPSAQQSFPKMSDPWLTLREIGNPFEEESTDLVVLDTKEIARPTAVNAVWNAKNWTRTPGFCQRAPSGEDEAT